MCATIYAPLVCVRLCDLQNAQARATAHTVLMAEVARGRRLHAARRRDPAESPSNGGRFESADASGASSGAGVGSGFRVTVTSLDSPPQRASPGDSAAAIGDDDDAGLLLRRSVGGGGPGQSSSTAAVSGRSAVASSSDALSALPPRIFWSEAFPDDFAGSNAGAAAPADTSPAAAVHETLLWVLDALHTQQ